MDGQGPVASRRENDSDRSVSEGKKSVQRQSQKDDLKSSICSGVSDETMRAGALSLQLLLSVSAPSVLGRVHETAEVSGIIHRGRGRIKSSGLVRPPSMADQKAGRCRRA